jgi:hypothetical protein
MADRKRSIPDDEEEEESLRECKHASSKPSVSHSFSSQLLCTERLSMASRLRVLPLDMMKDMLLPYLDQQLTPLGRLPHRWQVCSHEYLFELPAFLEFLWRKNPPPNMSGYYSNGRVLSLLLAADGGLLVSGRHKELYEHVRAFENYREDISIGITYSFTNKRSPTELIITNIILAMANGDIVVEINGLRHLETSRSLAIVQANGDYHLLVTGKSLITQKSLMKKYFPGRRYAAQLCVREPGTISCIRDFGKAFDYIQSHQPPDAQPMFRINSIVTGRTNEFSRSEKVPLPWELFEQYRLAPTRTWCDLTLTVVQFIARNDMICVWNDRPWGCYAVRLRWLDGQPASVVWHHTFLSFQVLSLQLLENNMFLLYGLGQPTDPMRFENESSDGRLNLINSETGCIVSDWRCFVYEPAESAVADMSGLIYFGMADGSIKLGFIDIEEYTFRFVAQQVRDLDFRWR